MKHIKTLLATLCIALMAVSCSNEMDGDANTITDAAQLIKIGNFPTFDEGTQTRAIGTPDDGKTTWEANDVLLLKFQLKNTDDNNVGTATTHTLTYNGSTWIANPSLNITLTDYRYKADITAYYAPAYEWSDGSLALKSGKQAGTDEYLICKKDGVTLTKGINIDFSGKRDYSRLRVAATSDMSVVLTAAEFTPAGSDAALSNGTITATADSKGNAYFYGTWMGNTQLNVELKEEGTKLTDVSKTTTATSDNGKSYAIDGFVNLTTYTAAGAGTKASPYRIYNATQLMSFNEEFATSYGDKFITLMNDIDLTGKDWTPLVTFGATFDGNFHTIKGMTIVNNKSDFIGLANTINAAGIIQNLIIDGVTINDSEAISVGVFTAGINNGNIINCHVINGTITATKASNLGGLVKQNDGNVIGCSVINTAIKGKYYGNLGGLIHINNAVMKGCMFHGPFNNDDDDEGYWVLAARKSGTNSASSSVYCENTITGKTITLWGVDQNEGAKTNWGYVDGTTIIWDTAITNMNAAISSEITDYQYVFDNALGCPKMVKK